jgi:hypothetical protein
VSEQPAGGFDLGVFASLGASLGKVAAIMENQQRRRERLFEQLHQVPIGPQLIPIAASTNGVLQMPDQLAPKAGFMWSVRRLTVSGFTAGTVVAYKNGAVVGGAAVGGGEPMIPFSAAGVFTCGRGEELFDQNDQLIFVATGITLATGYAGVQVNGAADCFERWLLPDYLGIG